MVHGEQPVGEANGVRDAPQGVPVHVQVEGEAEQAKVRGQYV